MPELKTTVKEYNEVYLSSTDIINIIRQYIRRNYEKEAPLYIDGVTDEITVRWEKDVD
jgi:hypothetical protein